MARFTFNLPDIGEGITEAEIVAWHVSPGDHVEEDGRLADMMTDKATVEMESPVAGRVLEVGGAVGDMLAIGSTLVVIETDDGAPEGPDDARGEISDLAGNEAGDAAANEPEAAAGQVPSPSPGVPAGEAPTSHSDSDAGDTRASTGEGDAGAISASVTRPEAGESVPVLASPAVRRRARDLGIALEDVAAGGAGGRIRHGDLDAFLAYNAGYGAAGQARPDEAVKVIGLRRRIAENMAASKQHIPHFTYVEECDVTALEKARADLNGADSASGAPRGGDGGRPRLTLLPLLITAICRALPAFPMINARYDDAANIVTRHGAVHMGLATATDAGLIVPVIRNAHALNLWQLAAEITRLAEAARIGRAQAHELSGSTITISSLGPLGGIASTPIVNRPEVAILAPNRIVERPAFMPDPMGGERIEKRKLMNLSISCDHRVVDGQDAAAFVQEVKRLIEAPALILTR